jgi:large subunit ribosomal protein L5
MATLRQIYKKEIVPKLMKKFGYKNVMQVPRVTKIVVNAGVGEAVDDPKVLEKVIEEITAITGQKPLITRAKKSISAFKLRARTSIGCKVTLRREKMYDFLNKLINIALPKIKDFRGVSLKSFDGRGNYSLGIKEQIIFSEIDSDKVDKVRGMDITVVTSAEKDEAAAELLRLMGMPFKEDKEKSGSKKDQDKE